MNPTKQEEVTMLAIAVEQTVSLACCADWRGWSSRLTWAQRSPNA